MKERIEKLILELKKNSKFNILIDKEWVNLFASSDYYHERTDLESNNIKIIYFMELFGDTEVIGVYDKIKNVYAFCNNLCADDTFMKKPVIKQKFTIDELKEYIEKNL